MTTPFLNPEEMKVAAKQESNGESVFGPNRPDENDWPCGRCGHVRSWHQKATWCRFEDCSCRDYYEAPEEDTDDLERGNTGDSGVGSDAGS